MKVIFVMLTFFFSSTLYSLDEEDVFLIDEYDLVKTRARKERNSWDDNPPKLDIDKYQFKNQTTNLTDWKNIKAYNWFSFKAWAKERDLKDKIPDWSKKVRESRNAEIVGRVLKCMGVCSTYRGLSKASSEYLSVIKEGDEFLTHKDSSAWILLSDGSILKVSPKSSVTLHEINFASSETLVMMRLNKGHIYFETRKVGNFKMIDKTQSDISFYPLALLKANREYYMINEYRAMNSQERSQYVIAENPGYKGQYEELNRLMKLNNPLFESKDARFYIYTANMSIEGKNSSVHLFYEPDGQSLFKLPVASEDFEKNDKRKIMNTVFLRGYNNYKSYQPEGKKWFSVDKKGEALAEAQQDIAALRVVESFLKRVPSIYIAREIWINEIFQFILAKETSEEKLAKIYGYRVWNVLESEEIEKRLLFVREYVRRVETTNLLSLKQLLRHKKKEGFNKSYYEKSMQKHYLKLKERFNEDNIKVREMSNTHFYLWALKNG